MGTQPWQRGRGWVYAVAIAAAVVSPWLAGPSSGEAVWLSFEPVTEGRLVAVVPAPPEPLPPPTLDGVPEALESEGAPDLEADGPAPAVLGPGIAQDLIRMPDDAGMPDEAGAPEPTPTVQVPPGIPVPTYPIVVNGPVEALIGLFAARDRERFGLWIARSGRYLDMIQRIFRERGLPEDLAYTAMIESGFSPRAVSRVGAKGMWQFMDATARRYGLVINRWVDERLDPVKSTIAAAEYLSDLYGLFGHWFLAQAAYNAGEARVGRAIQRAKTSDFWQLTQTRHLPDETKLFVPQILAATVITREPARYGFDVTMEPALAYDEVSVKRPLDLGTIAELARVTVEQIRDLNPALLSRITPPFGVYTLRLPVGAGSRFDAALHSTPPGSLVAWGIHRIGRNQSLAEIARLYRVTPQHLAEVNRLPGGRLRGFTELVVPVSNRAASATATVQQASPPRDTPGPAVASDGAGGSREITVRRGDTLWGIANRYGVRPEVLARLNGIEMDEPLPAGTRLRITSSTP